MKKLILFFSLLLISSTVYAQGFGRLFIDRANRIKTDTSSFDTNLSSADDTVQKALDTLDEVAGGGGGSAPTIKDSDTTIVASGQTINFASGITAVKTGNTAVSVYTENVQYNVLTGADGNASIDFSTFTNTWTSSIAKDDAFFEIQAGLVNMTNANLELPNSTVLANGDCDEAADAGRIFVDTDATSGSQLYVCEGAAGWVLSSGGGSTAYDDIGDPDANGTIAFTSFTNTWTTTIVNDSDFFEIQAGNVKMTNANLQLPNTTVCPASDCNAAGDAGRICIDTDATSGQQLYVCEGTAGWVQQGGAGSGDITDVYNCSTGDCATITMGATDTLVATDGSFIDFSAVNNGDTGEGILLPQATDCTSGTAEGQICWETADHVLVIGNGAGGTVEIGAGGSDTNALKLYTWSASDTLATQSNEAGFDGIAPLSKDDGTTLEVMVALFDDTADECRGVSFKVPEDVDTSGTAQFHVSWYSGSATSGNIMWFISWHEVNEGESWDAATTKDAAAADATQGTVDLVTETTWTETLSTLGWTADETVTGYFCRDGDDGSDTLVGDASAIQFSIEVPRT